MAPTHRPAWRPDPATVASTPLGIYVHVPFCERRCGYCAFRTVAVGERVDADDVARLLTGIEAELTLADALLGGSRPPLTSIYLGGGTPTMLASDEVASLLGMIRARFDLADDLEISIESNPDGLRPGQLEGLHAAGVNRISFGLQSVRPRVLELLDRTHDPERALATVADARTAGFSHVGLDLIHGTPGETAQDWAATLRAVVDTGVDHVSAYALSIEPGTKLAARVRAGDLPAPSGDDAADRYVVADELLTAAGLEWYELSNWARTPEDRSRHNLLYWRNHHWWGVGPSAHSHVAGRRWWNHDHLAAWAAALDDGEAPESGSELVAPAERSIESVMLGIRLAEGLAASAVVDDIGLQRVLDDGLATVVGDRVVLTLRGRLLADHVVRELI